MPPTTQDPLVVAAYVVGALLSLPALFLIWKVAVFFVKAITKLDKIDVIDETVRDIQRARSHETYSVEMSLNVIESDINRLQEKAGLPVRDFPDRRIGPADRRQVPPS